MARPLTPKQQRFVDEYLKDLNATQAAVRAGYSEKTARSIGEENLTKPDVQQAITAAQQARSRRVKVDQDYVLANLTEVLERCMERAPVMVRRGRGSEQATDDDGRHVWAFNAKGALGALALLARHLGMLRDKLELSGADLFGPSGSDLARLMLADPDLSANARRFLERIGPDPARRGQPAAPGGGGEPPGLPAAPAAPQ